MYWFNLLKKFKKWSNHRFIDKANKHMQKATGIQAIRICYPDKYGDIGPGDDNPDNGK